MNANELCRTCLRCSGSTCSINDSTEIKFDSKLIRVIDMLRIFTEVPAPNDDRLPDQICADCVDTIRQAYSFKLMCKRSENVLKQLKRIKINVKKLKNSSPKNVYVNEDSSKEKLHPNISQIKQKSLTFYKGMNDYRSEQTACEQPELFGQAMNSCTYLIFENITHEECMKHTLLTPGVTEKASIGQNIVHDKLLEGESGFRDELGRQEVFTADNQFERAYVFPSGTEEAAVHSIGKLQLEYIKQEPEVDNGLKETDLMQNEALNQSSTDLFKCASCCFECQILEGLEQRKMRHHLRNNCNREFHCNSVRNSFRDLPTNPSLKQNCSKYDEHLGPHTEEMPFKCDICSKSCSSKKSLRNHRTTKHPELADQHGFCCNICLRVFPWKSNYNDHLRSHTGEKPFKCEDCPSIFRHKRSLKGHIRAKHKIFETSVHTQCEICSKVFAQKSHLIEHLRTHTNERPYKCECCLATFRTNRSLRDHCRKKHAVADSTPNIQCAICSKAFEDILDLTEHLRNHTEENSFKCEICSVTFHLEQDLKIHMSEKHELSKSTDIIQCEVCSKVFGKKIYLMRHLKWHANDIKHCNYRQTIFGNELRFKSQNQAKNVESSNQNDMLRCKICLKVFAWESSLIDHLRSHTEEKPFKCGSCPKTFRYKRSLKIHIKQKHLFFWTETDD